MGALFCTNSVPIPVQNLKSSAVETANRISKKKSPELSANRSRISAHRFVQIEEPVIDRGRLAEGFRWVRSEDEMAALERQIQPKVVGTATQGVESESEVNEEELHRRSPDTPNCSTLLRRSRTSVSDLSPPSMIPRPASR